MDEDLKRQMVAAYDADAVRRASTADEREDWKKKFRKLFADLAENEGKRTVLEVGAGDGYDAVYFQKRGFDMLATDVSSKMVEQCRKRGVEAQVADLFELDQLGRRFDAVWSMNVLLHVPAKDLGRVLGGIRDVLNESGIFFLGTYGGIEREEVSTDPNMMNLPRFFSFLKDEKLKEAVSHYFEILSFDSVSRDRHTVTSKDTEFHFQGLMLRRK